MPTQLLPFKSSWISYSCWGRGPEIWIGIHGYGKFSESFDFLSRDLADDQYMLITLDLPFHGRTQWKEGLDFSVDDLVEIIDQILMQSGRDQASFKLIGYSLGGRIALSLTGRIPERISKLVLLAPDGLGVSAWYWLATQNRLGHRVFLQTILHPGWVFLALRVGRFCRIIDSEFFKLAGYYIQDKTARTNLYYRWMTLRRFKPDLKAIKSCIAKSKIKVELLLGRHDPMIDSQKGAFFQKGIEDYCKMTLIEEGHQLLQEKYSSLIISLLKD